MKISMQDFIRKYCMDIVQDYKQHKSILDTVEFTYDDEVEVDGDMMKVIYDSDGKQIFIEDIISLDKELFSGKYPTAAAQEAYRRYLDAFIILEGEDYLKHLRKQVAAEHDRLQKFSSINCDSLTCEF